MISDHACMSRALQLARRGLNTTHPNPRVGCVIVAGGEIVGQGWHVTAGGDHAEIMALREAGARAAGGTAFVTLEPCNHMGRTPPCVDALIGAGIARVVCAHRDPNPEVDGKGIRRLEEAGIEVQYGLLAGQAGTLNAGFIKRMQHGLPWVRVKLAQSMDGHISLANGASKWISGAEARADVQKWRARSDAILTGIGTVLADDPSLNVRDSNGSGDNLGDNLRQPLRVIADSRWRTPEVSRLLHLPGPVLIAGLENRSYHRAVENLEAECRVFPVSNGHVDLHALLAHLGARGINELQVEAGSRLCGALLDQHLVDELLIYQAPLLLGGGAVSPFATPRLDNMDQRIHLEWLDSRRIGNDQRLRLKPVYRVA